MDSSSPGLSDRARAMAPDLLMMNNNYLPGILPYNGMVGAVGASANVTGVNTRGGRPTTNEDRTRFCQTEASNNCVSAAAISATHVYHPCSPQINQQELNKWQETEAAVVRGSYVHPSNCYGYGTYGNVNYSVGHNFTFTTPTQTCLNSPALVSQPTEPRFQGSRTISHSFAPTGFTQWQHSVPQRLPWTSVGMTTQSGISVFTGSCTQCTMLDCSSSSQPSCPWPSTVMRDPVASCSEEPRRPKRHSTDNLQYLGPSTKIHLTEEKFAKHMEGLSIQCWAAPDENTVSSGLPHLKLSPDIVPEKFPSAPPSFIPSPLTVLGHWTNTEVPHRKCWKDFQELEDRLELSDEEEEVHRNGGNTGKTLPVVHMAKDIDQMISKSDILPKTILEEIQRPRMEIMLWTPPGDAVKAVVPFSDSATDNHDTLANDGSYQELEAAMEEDFCMDTEQTESLEL